MALSAEMAAARKKGTAGPPSAASDPTTGPMTKPNPKAAPSRPISRGRCSGAATSATVARATATLAPEAPSMIRPMNSTVREPASPRTRLPSADPTMVTTRTGLRPTRSEIRPQTGDSTN